MKQVITLTVMRGVENAPQDDVAGGSGVQAVVRDLTLTNSVNFYC